MVELRKRKTPPPAPAPAPKKERKTKATKANGKTEAVAEPPAPEPSAVPAPEPSTSETKSAGGAPTPGDKIDLEGFGGEVETNDGRKVTLKMLVDESKEGVVLFTYPKASTPGCRFILRHSERAYAIVPSMQASVAYDH